MPKTPNRRIFVRAAGMVLITGLSLGASATYAAADDGQNWNDQSQGQYSDNGSSNWSSNDSWSNDSNNNWNDDSNNNWNSDSNNNSTPESKKGTSSAAKSGAAVEQGLQPNALRVLNAVQKEFPEITDIGGVRDDALPDHPSGRALDLMIPNHSTAEGKAEAEKISTYLREHADELGIQYIISQQRIWNVERDGDGWRSMSDRGGESANHLDHVHVTVFPSDS